MTMIERVAAIIDLEAQGFGADMDQRRKASRKRARIILASILAPTDEMINAGLNCDAWANAEGPANEILAATYRAMIEAELRATK